MSLQTGQVLNNRYRIVGLLGQGGFGAVYRAWDLNLQKACAVKENFSNAPNAQAQFFTEAKLLANLKHTNLPRVTDYFIVQAEQYLVMDFVEGETLEDICQRQGRLPPAQAVNWIAQIADVLSYLHSQSPPIVHRDIKPENIRIMPTGEAMLVDFGIAKEYDPVSRTTRAARAVTPGYSPPEQYGFGNTDQRADIYALAATLYHLLTGQNLPESVYRVTGDTLLLANQVNPAVSQPVSLAIHRALSLDPNRRFQSATDFKTALLTPATPAPPAPPSPTSPTWRTVAPAIAIIAVLACVLLVGLAAISLVIANTSLRSTATVRSASPPNTELPGTNPTLAPTTATLDTPLPTEATPPSPTEAPPTTEAEALTATSVASLNLRGQIVYVCFDGNDDEICLINADGTGQIQLTSNDVGDFYPSLSPDGNTIVFARQFSGSNYEILEMSIAGSSLTQLTFNGAGNYAPEISPDGEKIAFTSTQGGDGQQIWVMERSGNNAVQLTRGGESLDPSWSPDGQFISFSSSQSGSPQLWVMNAVGGEQRRITDMSDVGGRNDWSPDGNTLVFYAGPRATNGRRVYFVDAQGLSTPQPLNFDAEALGPSLSPYGGWVVFTSAQDGDNDIYLSRLDGSDLINLTHNNGQDYQPRWGP